MLEIEPGSVACKTSALPAVLLHWPCTGSSDGVTLLVCSGQCPVGPIMHEDPLTAIPHTSTTLTVSALQTSRIQIWWGGGEDFSFIGTLVRALS